MFYLLASQLGAVFLLRFVGYLLSSWRSLLADRRSSCNSLNLVTQIIFLLPW